MMTNVNIYEGCEVRRIDLIDMQEGMVLLEDIHNRMGVLLLRNKTMLKESTAIALRVREDLKEGDCLVAVPETLLTIEEIPYVDSLR